MKRILDYTGTDAKRTTTVADLLALKGTTERLVQVTANDSLDAAAAEAAGIEMLVCPISTSMRYQMILPTLSRASPASCR